MASGEAGAGTVTLRRVDVDRDWVETEATWTIWKTSNNWTTAGCASDGNDRAAATSCTLSYPGGFSTDDIVSDHHANLIADVQDMINNPSTNHGWLPVWTAGTVSIALPAHPTAAQRPMLIVSYTT